MPQPIESSPPLSRRKFLSLKWLIPDDPSAQSTEIPTRQDWYPSWGFDALVSNLDFDGHMVPTAYRVEIPSYGGLQPDGTRHIDVREIRELAFRANVHSDRAVAQQPDIFAHATQATIELQKPYVEMKDADGTIIGYEYQAGGKTLVIGVVRDEKGSIIAYEPQSNGYFYVVLQTGPHTHDIANHLFPTPTPTPTAEQIAQDEKIHAQLTVAGVTGAAGVTGFLWLTRRRASAQAAKRLARAELRIQSTKQMEELRRENSSGTPKKQPGEPGNDEIRRKAVIAEIEQQRRQSRLHVPLPSAPGHRRTTGELAVHRQNLHRTGRLLQDPQPDPEVVTEVEERIERHGMYDTLARLLKLQELIKHLKHSRPRPKPPTNPVLEGSYTVVDTRKRGE